MKNVKITIKSIQVYENGEKDNSQINTVGEYEAENGVFSISYKDSEATGYEGCTTLLTVDANKKVTLMRTGKSNNSNLIVENGKKNHCVYSTNYGDLMMGVYGRNVISTLDENGGRLYLNYTIDINSAYVSGNEIYITVEET